MRRSAAGHQRVWFRQRFRAAGVALIIGAWGRVGRLGISRAISISVRAHQRTPYASVFLFVENTTERQLSATIQRAGIAVFRAVF
jgi:hypothetical protein